MRLLLSITVFASLGATLVHPLDKGFHPGGGDIDWGEAGVGSLRACAQSVFTGCCGTSQEDVQVDRWLGCTDKKVRASTSERDSGPALINETQCLCRRDLISDVHKYIKKLVSGWCGGKEVDVDAALKLYNDYCSSNGFPIPGYTYIRTKTVRITAVTTMASATTAIETTSIPTATPSSVTASAERSEDGSLPTTTTVDVVTATATVYPSSSRRLQPWPWAQLFALFFLVPVILSTVHAQTSVVIETESAPLPALSSVVTTLETVLTKQLGSFGKVTQTQSSKLARTESSLAPSTTHTADVGQSDGSQAGDAKMTSEKEQLSELEIAGIVIGIALGITTAIATVWMCIRARK